MTSLASGILVIDKPSGPTSHDVVARVRRVFRVKAGHTGTLDPLATGVLPVVVGQATRLARFYQGHDKEYLVSARLGIATDSYDREGSVIEERPVPTITSEELDNRLQVFRGRIRQKAPLYSAVKVQGRRLYQHARAGDSPERPEREVEVRALEVVSRTDESVQLRIDCSAGTYVRTLVHDLGESLGCGAHVESLRRVRSGAFTLEMAVPLDLLAEQWQEGFVPLSGLLPEFPAVDLSASQALRVSHGNEIPFPGKPQGEWLRLFDEGALVALARPTPMGIQPETVFAHERFGTA